MFSMWVALFVFSSICEVVVAAPETVTGHRGERLDIRCRYEAGYESYSKYLCKGECMFGDKNIMIKSGSPAEDERFSLTDNTTARVFTISITDLRSEDEGRYWCAVKGMIYDVYSEILLLVKLDNKTTEVSTINSFSNTRSYFSTTETHPRSSSITITDRKETITDQHSSSTGVFGQNGWGVSYSPSHICALKGSTVTVSCTYTYPPGHQIRKVSWTKTNAKEKHEEYPDLSKDSEYSKRLQYLGDKQQNCAVRLSHVTQKDEHEYYFRFITDPPDGHWLGEPGVTLTVTDLQVESPERVKEGDSVRLTCKSRCALTDRETFIWYRNSQTLTERRDGNNQLLLQSVRREDAGRYSCAVHGHTYTSPAVYLNVTYPPVNPVISISPSGEIVEGDSVTLSCSSDSNPPAEISWFKGRAIVGSERIYSISNIRYNHSGEYKCKSRNEYGEKYSEAVTLIVMFPRGAGSGVMFVITAASGGGLFIIIIIVVIILFIKKRKKKISAIHEHENDDPSVSTYTALDLKSRSSDVYNTLTSVHPRPAVH